VSSACADDARALREFQRKSTQAVISNICKFLAKPKTCEQVSGVRGSPLLRTIFLAIALLATGAGLSRITGAREGPVAAGKVVEEVLAEDGWGVEIPFRLLLSAPAEEVELDTGERVRPALALGDAPLSGRLRLDPKNPRVGLTVRWRTPAVAGEHRFAKLSLEIPRQATFVHVFDADGDIDELLELPLSVGK
jgi:hypothetical protein